MNAEDEIKHILASMFEAWNSEDQVGWLAPYARSEDMRWSMQGKWYKGWQSMQQIYGHDYLPGAMGIVGLSDLEVMVLSDGIAVALYHWTHVLPSESLAGSATQIFKKVDGAWRIVHENVARAPKDSRAPG